MVSASSMTGPLHLGDSARMPTARQATTSGMFVSVTSPRQAPSRPVASRAQRRTPASTQWKRLAWRPSLHGTTSRSRGARARTGAPSRLARFPCGQSHTHSRRAGLSRQRRQPGRTDADASRRRRNGKSGLTWHSSSDRSLCTLLVTGLNLVWQAHPCDLHMAEKAMHSRHLSQGIERARWHVTRECRCRPTT